MMTPKEKAEELTTKFKNYVDFEDAILDYQECIIKNSKICALIAVDLIIYHTEEHSSNIPLYEYYSEVKQEIKKL
jgi:hypothetical protein